MMLDTFSKSNVEATDIVHVCDALDEMSVDELLWTSRVLQLRRRAMEARRYEWLAKLLKQDYEAYVATASFLSPSRIPRLQLPNVQDVPLEKGQPVQSREFEDEGQMVVEDCQLQDMKYQDNLLDIVLLKIFRNLVTKNTGGVTSDKEGILGVGRARPVLSSQARPNARSAAQNGTRHISWSYDTRPSAILSNFHEWNHPQIRPAGGSLVLRPLFDIHRHAGFLWLSRRSLVS